MGLAAVAAVGEADKGFADTVIPAGRGPVPPHPGTAAAAAAAVVAVQGTAEADIAPGGIPRLAPAGKPAGDRRVAAVAAVPGRRGRRGGYWTSVPAGGFD